MYFSTSGAINDLFVKRPLDGQARNLAHLLKNLVSLRKELLGGLLLGDGAGREHQKQAEQDHPGENWKSILQSRFEKFHNVERPDQVMLA